MFTLRGFVSYVKVRSVNKVQTSLENSFQSVWSVWGKHTGARLQQAKKTAGRWQLLFVVSDLDVEKSARFESTFQSGTQCRFNSQTSVYISTSIYFIISDGVTDSLNLVSGFLTDRYNHQIEPWWIRRSPFRTSFWMFSRSKRMRSTSRFDHKKMLEHLSRYATVFKYIRWCVQNWYSKPKTYSYTGWHNFTQPHCKITPTILHRRFKSFTSKSLK